MNSQLNSRKLIEAIRSFFRITQKKAQGSPEISEVKKVTKRVKASDCFLSDKDRPELYVVWDAIGDGRVVGVFSNKEHAEKMRLINPFYYRYYRCILDKPVKTALEWLEEPEKTRMTQLCEEFETREYPQHE